MNLDDRLREAFRAKAATARTSPDAFTVIRDRARRQRRLRLLEIAGATVSLPAVIAIAFVVTRPATREPRVSDTPPVTSSPTETASPSPSATTPATDDPAPTEPSVPVIPPAPTKEPDESAYADAIAISRSGGVVDLISPSGTLRSRIATLEDRSVFRLEWSPDRSEVYVSSHAASSEGLCDPSTAIAIDVRSKKTRQLGAWSDFAFSSDGSQLAAIDRVDCGPQTLLIRNVASGKERRLPAARGDDASASFSSLAWVPGVDRVVLVQHGPGDSADLWLVDLSTATAINDGTRLEVGDAEESETVAGATYAGNRLIVALVCCLNTTERLQFVERIGTTGEVRELLSLPDRSSYELDASPDGKRLVYSSSVKGPDPWEPLHDGVWVWDFAGDPTKVADHADAVAW